MLDRDYIIGSTTNTTSHYIELLQFIRKCHLIEMNFDFHYCLMTRRIDGPGSSDDSMQENEVTTVK